MSAARRTSCSTRVETSARLPSRRVAARRRRLHDERALVARPRGRTPRVREDGADRRHRAAFLRDEHRHMSLFDEDVRCEILAWEDHAERPLLVLEDLRDARWPPPWEPGDVERVRATLERVWDAADATGCRAASASRTCSADGGGSPRRPSGFLSSGSRRASGSTRASTRLVDAERSIDVDGDDFIHMDIRSDNMCFDGRPRRVSSTGTGRCAARAISISRAGCRRCDSKADRCPRRSRPGSATTPPAISGSSRRTRRCRRRRRRAARPAGSSSASCASRCRGRAASSACRSRTSGDAHGEIDAARRRPRRRTRSRRTSGTRASRRRSSTRTSRPTIRARQSGKGGDEADVALVPRARSSTSFPRTRDVPRRRLRERLPDGERAPLGGRARARGRAVRPRHLVAHRCARAAPTPALGATASSSATRSTGTPPMRFDVVQSGLDEVPSHRRRELVERVLQRVPRARRRRSCSARDASVPARCPTRGRSSRRSASSRTACIERVHPATGEMRRTAWLRAPVA